MKKTLEDYQKTEYALSLEEMGRIHKEILRQAAADEESQELYRDLVKIATQYAQIRARWGLMTGEEKLNINQLRTMTHNSLIIQFNVLARYLRTIGWNPSWRDELGYEEDNYYNRKRIGDFGCYIVFINSINAR